MDILTYALAKSYTDKALLGVGTIKGAPCTVKSQTEDDEYVYVTLGWENNLGTSEETVVKIKKGADGAPGEPGPAGDPGPRGVSITKIEKIKTEDLIDTYQISFSDNTTFEYTISNGSTDYLKITNKPSIEGVELIGNKTFEDLNIASANDLSATDKNLQNLSDLIGDKTSLPAPTDTVVNNIKTVDAKVDAIIDDNEVGLAKTFSSDKITKTFATKDEIPTVPNKVSELTNDSNYQTAEQVNSTVATEIARVVADAPEDFDTLKEMSDWIAGHENDASAMNSAISDNKTAITALQTGKADKSEIPTTLPANGGNSDTVNNHTVETDVPADAVFTDTIYDDTEVKGSIDELNSNLDTLEFGEVAGGKNLFNKNSSNNVDGYIINGVPNGDTQYSQKTSHFIEINSKNFVYNLGNTNNQIAFYDSNRAFIKQITQNDGINVVEIPANAKYVRVVYFNRQKDLVQIEEGTQATPYEPYIPSAKMLAEEVSAQKNELDTLEFGEHSGVKNLFEDEIKWMENITVTRGTKSVSDGKITLTATSDDCYTDHDGSSWKNNGIKTIPCKPNKKYTFSWEYEGDAEGYVYIFENGSTNNMSDTTNKARKLLITTSADAEFLTIRVGVFALGASITYWNFQLEEGDTATPYEPYIPSVKMLAEENAQQNTEAMDLKMLGWTVPKECPVQNEVSGNQFIQKVGRVDLGSLTWYYASNRFYTVLEGGKHTSNYNGVDAYCNKYNNAKDKDHSTFDNKEFSIGSNFASNATCSIVIRDDSYTNESAFKNAMQGEYLYYELATPITMTIDGNEVTEHINESLSVIGKYKQLLNPIFARGWGCNGVVNNDGKIILTATNSYPSIFGNLAKFTFKANKTYHIKAFDLNNIVYINGNLASDENSNVFVLEENSNNWYKKYKPTEDTEIQFMVYFNDKTIGTTASCYISVSELYIDEYLPYTGDGETLTHDVAELNNDLDKLNSLPIGSIIQIEADKDDIETTKQKYGWQYLGTSNISYESGSANILVTNVYRKNN